MYPLRWSFFSGTGISRTIRIVPSLSLYLLTTFTNRNRLHHPPSLSSLVSTRGKLYSDPCREYSTKQGNYRSVSLRIGLSSTSSPSSLYTTTVYSFRRLIYPNPFILRALYSSYQQPFSSSSSTVSSSFLHNTSLRLRSRSPSRSVPLQSAYPSFRRIALFSTGSSYFSSFFPRDKYGNRSSTTVLSTSEESTTGQYPTNPLSTVPSSFSDHGNHQNSNNSNNNPQRRRRRRHGFYLLVGSLILYMLSFEYEIIEAWLRTFDIYINIWIGNLHPYGEFSIDDNTNPATTYLPNHIITKPEELVAYLHHHHHPSSSSSSPSAAAAVTSRTTRNPSTTKGSILYAQLPYPTNGRTIDIAILLAKPSSSSSRSSSPIVINAGTIAAARPLMLQLARSTDYNCTVIAYTHSSLTLPKRLYSLISTPSYDQYGTRLEHNNPFSFNRSIFMRTLNYIQALLSYTGDPLPLHSVLYMPLPESSPNHVPTSESQSNELSYILSTCRLDRAVLVSTAYHWLATFKCALRNPQHVAGLVCIDPYLPSTTPRLVIPTHTNTMVSVNTNSSASTTTTKGSSSSSSLASTTGLAFVFPLTPLEASVLQDTVKLRPTPRLSGPLQPVLNLPPYVLFAPQQLASKLSTLPASVTSSAARAGNASPTFPTELSPSSSPTGTLLLRDLLVHSILPTAETLRTNVTIGGADLIDAMFYRSQIIGGSLGPTGILPPWSLGTQVSKSSPWYTRWFSILGKEQEQFFSTNKKLSATPETNSFPMDVTNDDNMTPKYPLPLQTIDHGTTGMLNDTKKDKEKGKIRGTQDKEMEKSSSSSLSAPLTYTALTLEATSAASPFLDLTRIAMGSVYHNNQNSPTATMTVTTSSPSLSSSSSTSIDNLSSSLTTMATTLSNSSVSTDTDYTSDGNNYGTIFVTYMSALRQRALGLLQGKTYAPVIEDDVRTAYVTQMLESLKAENHILTLLDQASIAIEKQETAYYDYLEKEKLGGKNTYESSSSGSPSFLSRWWGGSGSSTNTGNDTNGTTITNNNKSSLSSSFSVPKMGSFELHNDKDAAIFLQNILTLWSKLPMNTSSLAYSSIKNSLIEIAFAQANVQFPILPSTGSNAASSSSSSPISTVSGAPNPSEIMKELRIDILARALAAKLDHVSPLVWNNPQLDQHTGKVLQLYHHQTQQRSHPTESSLSPSSLSSASSVSPSYASYSLSSLIDLYSYGIVRWALPVLYNYQPYRWTIPIHALDRYMEAISKISPAAIGTYEVRSSPALDTAIQKLVQLMEGPLNYDGNEKRKERKTKNGGAKHSTDNKIGSSSISPSPSSSSNDSSVSSSATTVSKSSSSSSASSSTVPLNFTMNIISFQGLLSWIKVNAEGAKNPLAWKYALQQAHQEHQNHRNSYASITNNYKNVSASRSYFQPPSSTIPFPVSILVTEVEDSALLEAAVEPPTLEQDITLIPHLTGLSAKGTVQGFQLPVLGHPHQFLVHMRALIQSYQKLTRTAWSHTLPDCVTVIPAETSQELSRSLTETNSMLKNKITTEGKFGWSGLLTSRGEIAVQIKNGTEYPYPTTMDGPNAGNSSSSSSSSKVDKQRYWPSYVDYSSGDPRDTLAIVSDVTSYGPPQPYRPALSKVTREILTVLEVEQERQRLFSNDTLDGNYHENTTEGEDV